MGVARPDNFCVGGCGRRDAFWFMEGQEPSGPYCQSCWLANAPNPESRRKGVARFMVACLLDPRDMKHWPGHWFRREAQR